MIGALGHAVAWATVPQLPSRWTATAFRLGADLTVRRRTPGVARLRANLRRVVPAADDAELDRLVHDAMRSYARYWRELFALPGLDVDAAVAAMTVSGTEHLDAAVATGRGVIVALPHSGNWDIAGVWLAQRYGRFLTVAQRLRPEWLYQRFVQVRAARGIDVCGGSLRAVTVAVRERLAAGGIVALVADRDLSGRGVPVSFFGATARFPAGPARWAAATGAALLPAACWFTPDGWAARVHPPVGSVQALADVFAVEIAEHPADWHMYSTLWPGDP